MIVTKIIRNWTEHELPEILFARIELYYTSNIRDIGNRNWLWIPRRGYTYTNDYIPSFYLQPPLFFLIPAVDYLLIAFQDLHLSIHSLQVLRKDWERLQRFQDLKTSKKQFKSTNQGYTVMYIEI